MALRSIYQSLSHLYTSTEPLNIRWTGSDAIVSTFTVSSNFHRMLINMIARHWVSSSPPLKMNYNSLKRRETFTRWHGVISWSNGLLNPVVVGKMAGCGLGGIRFPMEAWGFHFPIALRRTLCCAYVSTERFTGAQRMEHDATPAVTVC